MTTHLTADDLQQIRVIAQMARDEARACIYERPVWLRSYASDVPLLLAELDRLYKKVLTLEERLSDDALLVKVHTLQAEVDLLRAARASDQLRFSEEREDWADARREVSRHQGPGPGQ